MKVVFRYIDWNHRIAGIKAIRTLTGMGLKEAKELVDAAEHAPQEFKSEYDASYIRRVMLDGWLLVISTSAEVIENPVKSELVVLAGTATKAGDYDLAKDIIDVLKRHS